MTVDTPFITIWTHKYYINTFQYIISDVIGTDVPVYEVEEGQEDDISTAGEIRCKDWDMAPWIGDCRGLELNKFDMYE